MKPRRPSSDAGDITDDKINACFQLLMKEINDSFDRISKVAVWTAEDVNSIIQNLSSGTRQIEVPNPLTKKTKIDSRPAIKKGRISENGSQDISRDGMRVIMVGSNQPKFENNSKKSISNTKNDGWDEIDNWDNNNDLEDNSQEDTEEKVRKSKFNNRRPKFDVKIDIRDKTKGENIIEEPDKKRNLIRTTPERDDSYEWINVRETPKSPKSKDACPCDYEGCNYTTTNAFFLNRHTRAVHLKVKDFACSECKYKTAWKTDIKRHMFNRHNIECVNEK